MCTAWLISSLVHATHHSFGVARPLTMPIMVALFRSATFSFCISLISALRRPRAPLVAPLFLLQYGPPWSSIWWMAICGAPGWQPPAALLIRSWLVVHLRIIPHLRAVVCALVIAVRTAFSSLLVAAILIPLVSSMGAKPTTLVRGASMVHGLPGLMLIVAIMIWA